MLVVRVLNQRYLTPGTYTMIPKRGPQTMSNNYQGKTHCPQALRAKRLWTISVATKIAQFRLHKDCTTKIAQQRLHRKDCTTTIAQQRRTPDAGRRTTDAGRRMPDAGPPDAHKDCTTKIAQQRLHNKDCTTKTALKHCLGSTRRYHFIFVVVITRISRD